MFYQFIKYRDPGKQRRERERMIGASGYEGGSAHARKREKEGG